MTVTHDDCDFSGTKSECVKDLALKDLTDLTLRQVCTQQPGSQVLKKSSTVQPEASSNGRKLSSMHIQHNMRCLETGNSSLSRGDSVIWCLSLPGKARRLSKTPKPNLWKSHRWSCLSSSVATSPTQISSSPCTKTRAACTAAEVKAKGQGNKTDALSGYRSSSL